MPSVRSYLDSSMGPPTHRSITPSHRSLTPNNQEIFVNVAGKLYRTTRAVLTKSPFFRYHLSNPVSRDMDGAVVVNADPELFENILQYLQHGVYPLFVSPAGQHDVFKYLTLAREARYFHLERLVGWLEQGRFAQAYRVEFSQRLIRADEIGDKAGTAPKVFWDSNVLSMVLSEARSVEWGKHMIALCPRGVAGHRGRRNECWKVCFMGRNTPVWEYDVVPYPMFTLVTKTLVINHNLLRDQSL